MLEYIFNEETRYPEKGDKLFVQEGSNNQISWLAKVFQSLGSYADSYQIGAVCLINDALENEERRDFIIYPCVFLMRHYVELRLKEFIQAIHFCNSQKTEFPMHHNIDNLWANFKKLYSEMGEELNDSRLIAVEELLKELNSSDPISMAFRYPVDKNGNKTQKLEYVSLSNLKEVFVRLCYVFDGLSMQLASYVEMTEDMLADLYSEHRG